MSWRGQCGAPDGRPGSGERKNEPTVTISGKQWRARVPNQGGRGAEPKETKHENRKHAFGCVLSGTFGRHVDITRLGAVPRLGGGRCTMSDSGREPISDRRRIRGYEERSRTCVPGLPSRPWLSSLVPCRLRNARSNRHPRQHPANLHRLPASAMRRAYGRCARRPDDRAPVRLEHAAYRSAAVAEGAGKLRKIPAASSSVRSWRKPTLRPSPIGDRARRKDLQISPTTRSPPGRAMSVS
jgi:hypothetical protein